MRLLANIAQQYFLYLMEYQGIVVDLNNKT